LGGAGHFQADRAGQLLNGFREAQAVELLHKMNDTAVSAAAKTMIVLVAGVRVDIQGGRLFLMERAAGRIVGAGFLERDTRADNIDNVESIAKVVDELLGDQARHGAPSAARCARESFKSVSIEHSTNPAVA